MRPVTFCGFLIELSVGWFAREVGDPGVLPEIRVSDYQLVEPEFILSAMDCHSSLA